MINTSIGTLFLITVLFILLIVGVLFQRAKLPFLGKSIEGNKRIKGNLYLIEIVLVVSLLALLTNYFYRQHSALFYIEFLLLAIVIFFLGIFFLKDYLAGLIVKTSKIYAINDILAYETHEGKITAFAARHLEILNSNGDKILIPYSKLLSGVKHIKGVKDKLTTYTFTITAQAEKNTADQIRKMSDYIIALPWINKTIAPDISVKNTADDRIEFDITVYALDEQYLGRIEGMVREEFG